MSADFPSAMHVEIIRKALWRPHSRAAVMVGSGFSLNANAITSSAPPFPLWSPFITRLQKELRDFQTTDVLRLAEAYEYAASRTALDDLLLEMIPDGQYEPGQLHEMLLSLPWSDIFTTNYDTLLERTRLKVHEIRYDVVQTPEDIARGEKPRIIKLHGSFPSHRPFIFTAEDYRKYPKDFAPFVNMVQQSIMENVFCMIGFSGNDPNFLQWIGWVRDQLGTAAPKLYHCDVIDMNPAKERLYQSMRVIPIDLGPIVPPSRWTQELRRPKALEWLLLSLHNGKPLDLSTWPEQPETKRSRFKIDDELPPPMEPPNSPLWANPPDSEDIKKVNRDTLQRLTQRWRKERAGYPGWVVIPESNRQTLLNSIDQWTWEAYRADIERALSSAPLTEKVEFLHELVWRIRRSLVPLPRWLYTAATTLLEQFNPKPSLIKFRGLASEPEFSPANTDNTDNLTIIWVELAFALLNDAWQNQRDTNFKLLTDLLEKVVRLKPDWESRWYYEQCWYHLLRLDEASVRAILKSWPEKKGLPFWEAKRAALHAELGDVEEALHIAEAALERVRQGTRTASIDYANLSEEGWIIDLVEILDSAKDRWNKKKREELVARTQELRRHRCSPLEDGDRRERALLNTGNTAALKSKKRGFDPGRRSRTTQYMPWTGDARGWVLLQMFHDGSWPLRCGNVVTYSKGLTSSMLRIWSQSPRVALSIGLLGEKTEDLRGILGRMDVALLEQTTAQSIYEWLSAAFIRAMESKGHDERDPERISGLRERLLDGCPEILSRLTLHLSTAQLESAFHTALRMYVFEPFRKYSWRYSDPISHMFRRVLFAATLEQTFAWLPALLALPISGEEGFDIDKRREWPDPTEYVCWERGWRRPTNEEKASWQEPVGRLIRLVQAGPSKVRARATTRLARLAIWGGLTEKQMRSFLGALWSQTNALGLPADMEIGPPVLLLLPDERHKKAVAKYLLEQDFLDFEQGLINLYNSTAHDWHDEEVRKLRIEWTPSEAESLLRKILNTWMGKKPSSRNAEGATPFWNEEERTRIGWVVRVVGADILPYLSQDAKESLDKTRALLDECEQLGFSTAEALPFLLIFDKSRVDEIARCIFRAVHESSEEDVNNAVLSIFKWVALAHRNRAPPLPLHLLDAWVGNIVSRRQPGLGASLYHMVSFVEHFGNDLKDHHINALFDALDYLSKETKVSTTMEPGDGLFLEPEERLELREYASQLAAALSVRYRQQERGVPPTIETWRNIGTTDTLPEVRRAWKKHLDTPAI